MDNILVFHSFFFPFWGGFGCSWASLTSSAVWLCFLSRTHGDLVSGLYHQILLSLQKVLSDPVRPLCSHYGAVVGLHALGWKVCSLLTFVNLGSVKFLCGHVHVIKWNLSMRTSSIVLRIVYMCCFILCWKYFRCIVYHCIFISV